MKIILLHFILVLCCLSAQAQDNNNGLPWKKKVSWLIDTRDTITHQGKTKDKPLLKMIEDAVDAGKMTAYDPQQPDLSMKMPMKDFRSIFNTLTDTTEVSDPISGTVTVVFTTHGLVPDAVYHYKVTEEWSFDPASGKINVQIASIAPSIDIYGDDNVYRGSRSLFRISYKDLCELLKREDPKQLNKLTNYIWQANFGTPKYDNTSATPMQANAIMVIDDKLPDNDRTHFYREEADDSLLSEIMIGDARNGTLPAWNAELKPLSRQLTMMEVVKQTSSARIDTIEVTDPVTGQNMYTTAHAQINYQAIEQYKILEGFTFQPTVGKTEIIIKAITPVLNLPTTHSFPETPFWIKYKDLQPVLNKLDQYHPTSTFAMHIWNGFFLSDIKPQLEK